MKENQMSCVNSPLEMDSGISQGPEAYAFTGFNFSPAWPLFPGADTRVISLLLELK